MLTLVSNPDDAALNLSGGGTYVEGEQVSISASSRTGYRFVNWTNEQGEVISAVASFVHIKGNTKETLTANFEFDPNAPNEPGDINQNAKHWLRIEAEEGAGSITPSGRYKAGTSVTVTATAKQSFTFIGWFDENGNLLESNNGSYTLTMPSEDVALTAKFNFTPDNPEEPGLLKTKYILTLAAEEGGTVKADSYKLENGQSTYIQAMPNSGFEFAGWYKGDLLYAESPEFAYEMESSDVTFVAHFIYNPDSPSEPNQIGEKKYAFYMMNVISKPDKTVKFPVYLTTKEEAKDITFQLTFSEQLLPDMNSFSVSELTSGYSISYVDGENIEGRKAYIFTMTSNESSIPVGNTELVTFGITIPVDIETAKSYPVTINQISVEDLEGNTQHAGAKNGRLSVYKTGDANGDDRVSIGDAVSIVNCILGSRSDDFIEEAANVNDDEGISIVDAVGVVNIILGNSTNAPSLLSDSLEIIPD